MSKFKRKQDPPRKFDVHKTLPQSYVPDQRQHSPETSKLDAAPKKTKKRHWIRNTALVVFLLFFIPSAIFVGWNTKNASAASEKLFGTGNLMNLLAPASLANEKGRVNILVTGFSADDPGHSGAELTDSILVLSMDQETNTGYMLSIPRDLYIEIPGFGTAKINEAYQDGERSNFKESSYPKGGMGLLSKTISEKFDMELHYYVLIDYGSVQDVVTALEGITVNIDSEDPRGIYDPNFMKHEGGPLRLKNGAQDINASQALRLTRARGSTFGSYGFPQSDFDRAKNQREVIKGIKEKLVLKELLDPRTNSEIFNAFADNIKTNIKLNEVIPLYRLFNSIPDDQLKSVGFRDDKINLLASYRTPTGQSALIPNGGINNYAEIQQFIKNLGI